MAKLIRTYSINVNLYEWFDKYCKTNSINKSGFISKKIEELKKQTEKQIKQ